jgi:hypothetical protein
MRRKPLIAIVVVLAALPLVAEQPQSHQACLAKVPGGWGPNYSEQWHANEAKYWACRLGTTVEELHAWQSLLGKDYGMLQNVIVRKVNDDDLVLLHTTDGSAHCQDVTALKKAQGSWSVAWNLPKEPDSMQYCTMRCPAIRVELHKQGSLIVGEPWPSNPKEDTTFSCKSPLWRLTRFQWNGTTFESIKNSIRR